MLSSKLFVLLEATMRRFALAAAAAIIVGLGSTGYAHHSHPDFLTDQDATVEGTIERIDFKNPHVVMTLRTADSTIYTVEWQGANWLHGHKQLVSPVEGPVDGETLKVGDRIVVIGCPPSDPSRHELVRLKTVQRPVDGWLWTCRRPEKSTICI
jgi:hypothetical protein